MTIATALATADAARQLTPLLSAVGAARAIALQFSTAGAAARIPQRVNAIKGLKGCADKVRTAIPAIGATPEELTQIAQAEKAGGDLQLALGAEVEALTAAYAANVQSAMTGNRAEQLNALAGLNEHPAPHVTAATAAAATALIEALDAIVPPIE